MDPIARPVTCRRDLIDFWWYGYDFHKEDWDEGAGWENACDLERPLGRTFNALYALDYSVQNYPTRTDDFSGNILRWGGNFARKAIDELDARCTSNGAFASTKRGLFVDDRTELYLPFFYELYAVERAGTLIHEARHADGVSHNAGSNCPRLASCDTSFSFEGANRWQTIWLWWFTVDSWNYPAGSRERARDRANLILSTGFQTDPGFRI